MFQQYKIIFYYKYNNASITKKMAFYVKKYEMGVFGNERLNPNLT